MRHLTRAATLLLALPAAAAAAEHGSDGAADAARTWTAGRITVSEAWASGPATARDSVGIHLTVCNDSGRPSKLVIVESAAADRATMRLTVGTGADRTGRPVAALDIPAGQTVSFTPSGRHVALIGLKRDIAPGDTIPLRLSFLTGQDITVQVRFRADSDGTS